MFRTVSEIFGVTLEEDRAHDVVARRSVVVEIGERVGPSGVAVIKPQVMMRITNRQVWLKRRLGYLRNPCLVIFERSVACSHNIRQSRPPS